MQLALLEISNFRGVKTGRVSFSKHSVFVGPNNCGKTTVIEALALLFGRDRLVRTLTEHDFYGGDPQPLDRLLLIATVTGFEGNDFTAYPAWFGENRGVPKWLDASTGTVHPDQLDKAWPLVCQIAFAARFDRESLEVETTRYFYDDPAGPDVFQDGTWTAVPTSVIKEIGLFLVPANRAWDRVISFGSELFRRVVATGGGLPAEAVLHERDELRKPAKPLEGDANLAELVGDLNSELAGFFPSKPQLQLRLTSTDSEGVLEAVVPHYAHMNNGITVPARRHGSGLVSLQWLLLLLQFGRRRAEAGQGFWIALEEPELHVPPALQRRIVHRLQALSTQTIVSTHSPMVAALSDSRALAMLRNDGGTLTCKTLAEAVLTKDAPNAVRKLFQLNRTETIGAMMHDVTLVPEGRVDVDLLRLILHAIDAQQSWDEERECRFGAHVGLISTQDGSVVTTYWHLSRLHPRVACIVDGDSAGLGYVAELVDAKPPPYLILRWPDGWTVEDIVGWIARADGPAVIAAIGPTIDPLPADVTELVQRMKTKQKDDPIGLKSNRLAYETIADAITASVPCIDRARELMNAMSDALLGQPATRFVPSAANPAVRVFQP